MKSRACSPSAWSNQYHEVLAMGNVAWERTFRFIGLSALMSHTTTFCNPLLKDTELHLKSIFGFLLTLILLKSCCHKIILMSGKSFTFWWNLFMLILICSTLQPFSWLMSTLRCYIHIKTVSVLSLSFPGINKPNSSCHLLCDHLHSPLLLGV